MRSAPVRVSSALVAMAGAAACSSVTPLNVHDSGVFAPSGRVRVDLERNTPGGWFVEGAFSDMEGNARQQLASNHTVVVDGVSFSGPDSLQTDGSLRVGELVLGRAMVNENARVSIYGGVQTLDLGLEVRDTNQRASDERSSRSWLFGADFSVPLRSWLSFDGRADISYSLSGDEMAAQHFELGLGLSPVRQARVFAGLSYRSLVQVIAGGSDIDLEFFGPALGLRCEL